MKKKLLSTMFAVACMTSMSYAQTREVSGVVSSSDGSPISGASVSVVGSNNATQTDGSGRFRISVSPGASLNVSYIGYTSQRVSVGNSTTLSIVLVSSDQALEEVVVTGYGTQKKREITGSIASIKGEEFANVTAPSLARSLAGLAAGVQASNTCGILGQPANIGIRGVSSISRSSDPLSVVDGVPYITGEQGAVFYTNPLGSINSCDIESVEVLKDGAATAIYGSRAAGGVILITT